VNIPVTINHKGLGDIIMITEFIHIFKSFVMVEEDFTINTGFNLLIILYCTFMKFVILYLNIQLCIYLIFIRFRNDGQ